MRTIERSGAFKKDYKRLKKSGQHTETLQHILPTVLTELANDRPLDAKYCDHPLSGTWKDHRDCHIKPDVVLIYSKPPGVLQLVRLGSHSDLFD